jgi:hypothetical protein
MKLWSWYVARRDRKAREEYLREEARDDAAGWNTDPQKAMHDAAERITERNRPPQTKEW